MRRRTRAHLVLVPATTLAALAVAVVVVVWPAPAAGQTSGADTAWTRTLAPDLSAHDLGLRARAPARKLARAALARYAGRLGVSRSEGGLRLASKTRLPASAGGRALRTFRFQQTPVVCVWCGARSTLRSPLAR